jgi:hypothetical protein
LGVDDAAPAGSVEPGRPVREPRDDRRARAARRQFPSGAYFNVESAAGSVTARFFLDAGDPDPGPDARLIGGPYKSLELAIARARPELLYSHLLKTAIKSGLLKASSGHAKVTLPMLSEWTGYSIDTLQSWLRPRTSPGHRPMPRYAIRLILHEFKLRDQSRYPWDKILNLTR